MKTENKDRAMEGNDDLEKSETRILSEQFESPASSVEQALDPISRGDMRAHTEHTSVRKEDKANDVNESSKADPSNKMVHPNKSTVSSPSITRAQHSKPPFHVLSNKNRISVPLTLTFVVAIVAVLISLMFIDVERSRQVLHYLEDATSVAEGPLDWSHLWETASAFITHMLDKKNTPLDSVLPPPKPLSSTANSATSSPPKTPCGSLPKEAMKAIEMSPPGTGLHALSLSPKGYCFTLEEYSIYFGASDQQNRNCQFIFRCGTRVVDLRTETRPEFLAACKETKSNPFLDAATEVVQGLGKRNEGNCNRTRAAVTSFASLRVVLIGEELNWHLRNRLNAAAQSIPLERFNDDYCDCLDGTDELHTNACSMSGPGMVLAGVRWRPHLISTLRTRLYKEQLEDRVREQLRAYFNTDDKDLTNFVEERVLALRSIELGGPVLPIPCRSDPAAWLSPSLVGDGIVDCCDGSDEEIAHDSGENGDALFRGTKMGAVEVEWTSRRDRMATYLRIHPSDPTNRQGGTKQQDLPSQGQSQSSYHTVRGEQNTTNGDEQPNESRKRSRPERRSPYWDKLHPYYVSAAAVLAEKGYSSLFTCADLNQLRLEKAELVLDLVKQGHRIYEVRALQGWEALGRFLAENRSNAMEHLRSATHEITKLQHEIQSRMAAKRTSNPIQAGVPEEYLKRHYTLQGELKHLKQEYLYLDTILTQKVFGKHYEYYPLYDKKLTFNVSEAMPSDHSASSVWQRHPASRRVQFTGVHNFQHLGSGPPLHMDNVTLIQLALISTRQLLAVQAVETANSGEPTAAASAPNAVQPSLQQQSEDVFQTHPVFCMGRWRPFSLQGMQAGMSLGRPAREVDLLRRALVSPFSTLHRGGGRLQWPTRRAGRTRFIEIPIEDQENSKQRILSAASAKASKEIKVPVMPHTNTMDYVAVHAYVGGDLRCEADPPLNTKWNPEDDQVRDSDTGVDQRQGQARNPSYRFQSALVSFVCHPIDEVLTWDFNGKCNQEIIVGTPSACAQWVLNEAERQVHFFKNIAKQYETGHGTCMKPSALTSPLSKQI